MFASLWCLFDSAWLVCLVVILVGLLGMVVTVTVLGGWIVVLLRVVVLWFVVLRDALGLYVC